MSGETGTKQRHTGRGHITILYHITNNKTNSIKFIRTHRVHHNKTEEGCGSPPREAPDGSQSLSATSQPANSGFETLRVSLRTFLKCDYQFSAILNYIFCEFRLISLLLARLNFKVLEKLLNATAFKECVINFHSSALYL